MTLFDYVVVGVLLISVAIGAWRGVIGEILALAAWVLAFLAAKMWGQETGQALYAQVFADSIIRTVAGWATMVVIVLIILAIVRWALRSLLNALGMGVTDRILGVFFGLFRGVLIVFLAVALGGLTPLPKQEWWSQARLAPPFETVVLASRPWLPGELSKRIRFN